MDLTIDHNTAFTTQVPPSVAFMAENKGVKADRFAFTNNIVALGVYGWVGNGTSAPLATLAAFFTNYSMTNNAFIGIAATGASQPQYPTGNFFPADQAAVQFVDIAGGNFRLSQNSPYKGAAADRKDLGANMDLLPSGMALGSSAASAAGLPKAPKALVIVH